MSPSIARPALTLVILAGPLLLSGQAGIDPTSARGQEVLSWEPACFGGASNYLFVLYDPTQQDLVYIANDVAGLMSSTDGGDTWEIRSIGLGNYELASMALDPFDPASSSAPTAGESGRPFAKASACSASSLGTIFPNPAVMGSRSSTPVGTRRASWPGICLPASTSVACRWGRGPRSGRCRSSGERRCGRSGPDGLVGS